MLPDNFLDVKRRNEAMLFRTLPPRVLASLGSTVMDIQVITISPALSNTCLRASQLLNSITSTTDMDKIPFFDGGSDPSVFAEKINTLLTWSITTLQFGDHRPYAAATLLRIWRNRCGERAMRRDFTSPDDFLQDQLFDWLDGSELAGEEVNLSRVVGLFGKFVRDGLFQYAKYVQRLVARGEPGLSCTQVC
jgi:mediator of RNA polymerase II transcription subunit 12, fungi type